MIISVDTSIPVNFEVMEPVLEDTRFMKAKIWICHTGENLNGSDFSREVIEKNIYSLANIPVLGYIKADSVNEKDFAGHEQRLIVTEEGTTVEYLGRVYGVVPETNNAKFELKVCEDGIEREFLTAEVLMYTKFPECIDLIEKNGIKNHSMELEPNSIKGQFNENKVFNFTDFKFEGLCLLGDDVTPAMTGSLLEKFTQTNFSHQMKEMLQEFNTYFSNTDSNKKGGKKVNEKLELIQKYSTLKEEDISKLKENLDNYTIEELENELNKLFTEQEKGDPEPDNDPQNDPESEKTNEEETKIVPTEPEPIKDDEQPKDNFALASALFGALLDSLQSKTFVDRWGEESYEYYYNDHDENRVYAFDVKNDWQAVGMNYTVNGDLVTIDFTSVKKVKFVPQDMDESVQNFSSIKDTMQIMENKFQLKIDKIAEMETELSELKEKLSEKETEFTSIQNELNTTKENFAAINAEYAEKIKAEQDAQFNEFFTNLQKSKDLSSQEIESFKSQYPEKSFEDIKKDVIFAIGEKIALNFSVNTQKINHIPIQNKEEEKPKKSKSYDDLIQKFKG